MQFGKGQKVVVNIENGDCVVAIGRSGGMIWRFTIFGLYQKVGQVIFTISPFCAKNTIANLVIKYLGGYGSGYRYRNDKI